MDFLSIAKSQEQTQEQSFLQRLKLQKLQPLKYLVALVFVIFLFFIWFSLKPSLTAFDFVPQDTNFYWQWANKSAIAGDFDTFGALAQETSQAQLAKVNGLLQEAKSLAEEIVWFKIVGSEADNFLVKISGTLSKEELKLLNSNILNLHLDLLSNDILLISPDEKLKDTLQSNLANKFISASHQSGLNIYLHKADLDKFIKGDKNLWQNFIVEDEIFVHLDKQIFDVYTLGKKDLSFDWQQVSVPKNAQTLLAFSDQKTQMSDTWKSIIGPKIFSKLPAHILSREELQNTQLLLWEKESGEYLLAAPQDLRVLAPLFLEKLALKEEKQLLADGTAYQALVLADLQWQDLSWTGQTAWQFDNLSVLQLNNFYYLSNSQDLLRSLAESGDNQDILLCASEQDRVEDWLKLSNKQLDDLNLRDFLASKANSMQVLHYSNEIFNGLRFCW